MHEYEKKYSLRADLFFEDTAGMIEARHPQALLVYTSIGEHRAAIETAAKYGVSVMVEKPLTISLEDALAIREGGTRKPHPGAGELRDDLVREQPRRV